MKEHTEFVKQQISHISEKNRGRLEIHYETAKNIIANGEDWYGEVRPTSIAELENYDTFERFDLLPHMRSLLRSSLSKFLKNLKIADIQTRKTLVNDRGVGVFSYDLAAHGLYASYPIDLATNISTGISQMNIELRQKVIRTNNRRTYLHIERDRRELPSLQLFVTCGAASNIRGKDMYYVGLACAELVSILEKRGIPVQINVILGLYYRTQINASIVRIKAYHEPLNINLLLLMTSDPKYWRFKGFLSLIAQFDYNGWKVPQGLGYREPKLAKICASFIDPQAFVFEHCYSLDDAKNEVLRILKNYEKINFKNGESI
ncbi:MAG: hypothetical protein WBA74_01715 [Cyclobacteriaceae bacterium]